MRAVLFLGLLTISAAARSGHWQPTTVTITVVDQLSGRPLPNADILDRETEVRRLTDENGQARVSWPSRGRLQVRVREVGYQPVERTLSRDSLAPHFTVTIALSRIAYAISPVRSTSRCVSEADSASRLLSVSALEQLRQGAEKYLEFRKAYPFRAIVERRTGTVPPKGEKFRVMRARQSFDSKDWELPYRPGNIITDRYRSSFTVPILFLSTLGDAKFWENHCFVARGVEQQGGDRVVRLDFSPVTSVTGPDWGGSAFLDSATSVLRRVDFQVANLGKRDALKRLYGYTTFRSPSPFVSMPDTTVALWWLEEDRTDRADDEPSVFQSLNIDSLVYKKDKPPPAAETPRQ